MAENVTLGGLINKLILLTIRLTELFSMTYQTFDKGIIDK